jgi:hypothetical protein
MAYLLESGIQVSLNNTTWYKLTDHNRQPVDISTELIETQSRMANGRLRKYVVATKNNISVSWDYVPSKTSETADLNYGAAWLESFYKSNVGVPIYLKVVSSGIDPDSSVGSVPSDFNFKTAQTGSKVDTVFMTGFSKTIVNRTRLSDYVNMSIEFTEI